MVKQVYKRNGDKQNFEADKIAQAIFKAAKACGGEDEAKANELAAEVVAIINEKYDGKIPTVEDIQNVVEKVLIENRHAQTAKAYILYREKRNAARQDNALIGATISMFNKYLYDEDWLIKENANTSYSVAGLNLNVVPVIIV